MDECPICMEALKFNNRKIHTTGCNHSFHAMCFKKVKSGACPCCRAVIPQGISIVIANIKKEIKDVKYALKFNIKLGRKFKSDNHKNLAMLVKKENEEKKLLSDRVKDALCKGLGDDFDTVLWVSTQEEKIKVIEKERQKQYIKIVLLESDYPRMIEYYNKKILEKTTLLDEAQQKKLLGAL